MLLQPDKLNEVQRSAMEKLCQLFPQVEAAKELAQEVVRIVRERLSEQFNGWLHTGIQSRLKEFMSFAIGPSEDYGAVINALGYP